MHQTKIKPDLNNVSMFSVYYLAGKKTKFLFDRTSSIEAGKRCEWQPKNKDKLLWS